MKNQKFVRVTTLALVVSMANIFVLAVPRAGDIPVPASSVQDSPVGILSGKKSVTVNGNPASEGMTILSGSEIRTDGSGAIINIRGVGTVQLCRRTTVKLNYTKDSVELTVIGGEASLTTIRGVTGDLNSPGATTLKTDPSQDTSPVQTANFDCAGTAGTAETAEPGSEGLPGWVALVGIGAAAITAIVLIARADRQTVSGVRP